MFDPGGFKVTEDLSLVLGGEGSHRFQFYDELVVDQHVGKIVANESAIFVEDFDRVLLLNVEAELFEAMRECILVDFLQMSVGMIHMNVISRLPHLFAE